MSYRKKKKNRVVKSVQELLLVPREKIAQDYITLGIRCMSEFARARKACTRAQKLIDKMKIMEFRLQQIDAYDTPIGG